MLAIETIAVLFSIISVVLAVKKSIHTWTTGIVGIAAYLIVFLERSLYSNAILQVIFIITSILGYYSWKNHRIINLEKVSEKLVASLIVGVTILFYTMFKDTDNPLPLLDAIAVGISLGATYKLSLKQRNAWMMWMSANILYIIIFFHQNLLLSCSLYVLFTYLAWQGYKTWEDEKA